MKRFRFAFERLLKLRKSQVEMRSAELGQERLKLDQEMHKLKLFRSEADAQVAEMRTARLDSFCAGDQCVGAKYLARVGRVIDFQQGAVGRQQSRVEVAQARLIGARRDTQIMEKLKDKKQAEWQAVTSREETAQLDEIGVRQTWRAPTHEAQ